MDGVVLPNSREKLKKMKVTTQASATLAEETPSGAKRDNTSVGGNDRPAGNINHQNGRGFHFQLGILKDCEVQVQAFLEDADSVLAALDQCQAEEKCLMLIKRPKESAKKMLKSHSLSNLSVSDPQLYRQFNGLQLSQVHHPGPMPAHKGRRSLDQQSVTSNDTDRSEPRRRYVSAKGKENWKQQQQQQQQQQQRNHHHQQQQRTGPDVVKSPDYYHSDSSSSVASSDYQYVSRRDRERDRESRRRGDLRYSSIPEDSQEINNNGGKDHGGSMYHSCHDISFASQTSSTAASNNNGRVADWNRQGHPHPHPHHQGHPNRGQGQIPNDQMYGQRVQRPSDAAPIHDPGDMDDVARSRSLGNLSTGLTLSLIGQRKADSMLDLSTASSAAAAAGARAPPQQQGNAPLRQRRSVEGGSYDPPESVRSPDSRSVRSPRHSYPDSVCSARSSEGDEVFITSPRHSTNGYYNNGIDVNPHHHPNHPQQKQRPQQKNPSSYHHQHQQQPHHHHQQQQHNGYGYSNSGSSSSTPQSDTAPPKPKRSLPHVPLNETSERIKRFTELMRSRMSVCSSSAGRSTSNSTLSQTPATPRTPPSRQASVTDNGSDCEVSTLLKDSGYSSVQKHPAEGQGGGGERGHYHQQHQRDVREKEGMGAEGRGKAAHHPYPSRHPSSSQETPQPYNDHHSESGQTPFTSHSHSSTMDSGYTTNTEGDADSTVNTSHHHLSPPHQQYHHHPQQHHPQHQPQPNHHHPSAAEGARPAPVPRNLSLAAARKFSSMQNVSTTHGQNLHGYPSGPPQHPGEWGGQRNPQPKGPAPMRVQHPTDYHAVVEHQRRSWDLAHNFKSLDFMPEAQGGQMNGHRPQGREDHVVKPQAVSVNGGGSVKPRPDPASPRRTESQKMRGSRDNGQGRQGNAQDQKVKDYCQPPPPPVSEATGINTLPGHWKYNTINNGNVVNNNNNSVPNNSTKNNNTPRTSQKSDNTINAPTLFQISQCFDLCSVKMSLPQEVPASRLLSLSALQVTLPALNLDNSSTPVHSPQGRCARLGGPGSAFRPVRTGSRGGGQTTVELVAVSSMDSQCQELCTLGEIRPGDLLMEVNGRQSVGLEVASVQRILETALGELTLTIARRKEEKMDSRVMQLESSLQKLQVEVRRMNEELTKKDARIRELSTMLPWKREEEANGDGHVVLEPEEGAFVIGDNEFVV